MNILIVVAHPDDEVLGCGGTGAALAAAGHSVRACFVCAKVEARGGRPEPAELDRNVRAAQRVLGFGEPFSGGFPNLQLNSVPHLDLVQFIELAIAEAQPQIVFTHHPSDVNDDHAHVSRACQAAVRLPQRRAGIAPIGRVLYMEIPSSTDWSLLPAAARFAPDTFVSIGEYFQRKVDALAAYSGVMRPYPHPRSEESLRGLATVRGAQCGLGLAESFQTALCAGRIQDVFGAAGA